MGPIDVQFLVIKVKEDVWDVAVFAEQPVLKAFAKFYHGFYVEESVFEKQPMCVIPEFPNQMHAQAWKEYWLKAFRNPGQACGTCTSVHDLFEFIENEREN